LQEAREVSFRLVDRDSHESKIKLA
jgi:hypothetical protein